MGATRAINRSYSKSWTHWTSVFARRGACGRTASINVSIRLLSKAMVAWYDRQRDVAAPAESCCGEGRMCTSDYAEHHGAGFKVSVNRDEYEFYFADVPHDFTELDRETGLAAHADASRSDFDDVQGG